MVEKADPSVQDMTILVVDDEKSISRLVSIILQRYGFKHVLVANTGLEALELMGIDHPAMGGQKPAREAQAVDLVLLDIMLPSINGFEVCKAIKNSPHRDVPVMLITGFNIEQHHARYIECGADDFLTKPINPRDLTARVNLHLCHSRIRRRQGRPAASAETPDVGSLLHISSIGSYVLEKSLSWSGSVAVYKARRGDTPVVIKVLTQQAMEYEDVVERFRREAAIMARFSHPNVIRLVDQGEHQNLPYYVMEYVDGANLEVYNSETPRAPFDMAYRVACSLASALEHVHAHGVVHRDIKLKNIFLDQQGEVKLGDFGIALSMGDVRLTQTGYAIGTPVYMAPEQFEGKNVTPSADIYSFGATVYHLIVGLPPFTAANAMELLRKHMQEKPPYLRSRRPEVPLAWDNLIVDRCLAKKPADRPATMTEVRQVLETLKDTRF